MFALSLSLFLFSKTFYMKKPFFPSAANERVYLILKTTVRLSHPAPMDLILRKRLALNIYKRQSITDRLIKKIVRSDVLAHTAVTYQVVSNIPKVWENAFSTMAVRSYLKG